MVQDRMDYITGAFRESVYMNEDDARKLGLQKGDPILLKNDRGEINGKVVLAPLKPGNLQVHWPEGNVLLDRDRKSQEGVPDYNAVVRLEKL